MSQINDGIFHIIDQIKVSRDAGTIVNRPLSSLYEDYLEITLTGTISQQLTTERKRNKTGMLVYKNVKKAEPTGPKFCVGPRMTPAER